MGKKTMKNSEEKPSRHKIPAVASGQQKQATSRRLRSRQKLEVQLRNNDESVDKTKEISRQRMLARKLVKIPINFSLILPDNRFCKETYHLSQKLIVCARENVPETEMGLLAGKLLDKFGPSYRSFVVRLLQNIWLKVHLRCLQEDAGVSYEEMAEMHPLHLLMLLDGVNNTHTPSVERTMKVLASEFGLHTPDIITELVEKMVKAFAEVAPDDFAKVAHEDALAHAIQGISLASQ